MNNQEAKREKESEDAAESPMAAASMDCVAATALRSVLHRVQQAADRSGRSADRISVLAVSKTKPVSLIHQVYDAGHRFFGENYVQEIVEKSPQVFFHQMTVLCLGAGTIQEKERKEEIDCPLLETQNFILAILN
ncbi:putative pyridoxal phosphate-dependent enzyme, YBL036C type [Actinidia rufa]|uniref:Putative pyridoxal phosphate-dependent enzyme, YBL036C type n=1 Tax=Actinidia rufa TaxID=165716 RepID=A0A7J0EZB7_9ERIC|nr:putative pyridoxal phosphate-dependent enzyme, YBL036C type [Actinidia rufa]